MIQKTKELYNLILDYLRQNGESSLSAIRADLASYFYIPNEEAFDRKDKQYSIFEGRVNRACWDLCYAGLVERTRVGFYRLAEEGEDVLERDEPIDNNYLCQYDSYRDTKGITDYDNKARKYPEYVPIESPSFAQIVVLRKQDTRFANMVAAGVLTYEDGTIKAVEQTVSPREARELLKEGGRVYKDTNNPGNFIYEPPGHVDGYYRPKRSRTWQNPLNWVSQSGAAVYNDIKEILEFFNAHQDYSECLKYLIQTKYKITKDNLSKLSGIDPKQIQRLMNGSVKSPKITELLAILWVLKAPERVIAGLLDVAGISTNNKSNSIYILICAMTVHSTYKEVNDKCREEGLLPIFSPYLENNP